MRTAFYDDAKRQGLNPLKPLQDEDLSSSKKEEPKPKPQTEPESNYRDRVEDKRNDDITKDSDFASVKWFGLIDTAMAKDYPNLKNIFDQKKDRDRPGNIWEVDFDDCLVIDLKLKKDANYNLFITPIKSRNGDIDLLKLREGLMRERIFKDVFKKLKMKADQSSPQEFFEKWDHDRDKELSEAELKNMIDSFNHDLKQDDFKFLFFRFEGKRYSGITLEEFKRTLWSYDQ